MRMMEGVAHVPKKIDHDAIAKAYERLKNGRAVARLFNIHEQTVYQAARRMKGNCVRCSKTVLPGETQCDNCKLYYANRMNAKRKERRRLGLCQDCDHPYELPSRSYCTIHRLSHNVNSAHHTQRKNAKISGTREGEAISYRQKMRHIKDVYGPSGVKCYEEADGKCEICGRGENDVKIHIHHINLIGTDHRRENFIVLCYDHHTGLHRFVDKPGLQRFLDWVKTTYSTNQPLTGKFQPHENH